MGKISETESIILPNVPAISGEKPAQEPSVRKRREKTGKQQFKKKKKNKLRTIVLLVVAVLVLGGGGYGVYRLFFYEEPVEVVTGTTVRDTIETLIEGTAVTSPTSFQMLTVPVDGVVDKVFVSQGDTVEVGDPLYSIDGDSIEEDLADLEATIADYEDQLAELYESVDSLTISAPFSGKLLDVAVENGDEVGASTAVATLVDDSKMILELYYSVAYRDYITKGMDAEVSISQYMTTLSGTVTGTKDVSYITPEGAECFKVIISVDNPGTLTEGLEATATINSSDLRMSPADAGTLEYYQTKTISAGVSGDITLYSLDESLRVSSGELLAVIDNDTYESQIKTLEKKIDSARLNLEELNEDLADCAATADVAGTVIFVRIDAGDEVDAGTSSMAIYNTDTMEIEANISEIQNEYIKMGMEVTITKSGASTDQTFTGIVTEVSLEATSSNGVAYFPTTITIESEGKLSAGVYVTYTITAAQAEDAVLAPVAAIKKTTAGECLFIQADTVPENAVELDEGVVPDGFYAVLVETGLQSNNYIQITSGVDEGVTVYIQTCRQAAAYPAVTKRRRRRMTTAK
jgi:multidrug resistance efflux pump